MFMCIWHDPHAQTKGLLPMHFEICMDAYGIHGSYFAKIETETEFLLDVRL